MSKNMVVIVAGPTASGKSQLAMDIALALDGVVINADSMQVYKDTPILSAVPSVEDRVRVEHVLYEVFDASKKGSVVDWLGLAAEEIKKAWARGKVPIVAGGTGLYIDNLMNGTTPIPDVGVEAPKSVSEMYDELRSFDLESYERLNPNDKTRITRAYNVFKKTGVTLSEWHKKPMNKVIESQFFVVKIMPEMSGLEERCSLRFDKMINEGALDEVRALSEKKLNENLPAMRALGVPELLGFVRGETSLEEAIAMGKLHTRQYAKRQKTWFRNQLKADVVLDTVYKGQKEVLKSILDVAQNALSR